MNTPEAMLQDELEEIKSKQNLSEKGLS